jgi:two-component system sensor histidine kinase PilS (NtrC family)
LVWLSIATVLACGAALVVAVAGHAAWAGMAACVGLCGAAILIIRYDSARRTLERLRSDTESVLHCLSGGLITIDLDARITRFNPAAERILGLRPEDLRGRSLAEVFELRAPLLHHKLTRSLHDGIPIHRFEFQMHQPDGRPPRPIGLSTSLMKSPRAEQYGILATFQDLSEVRRMQARVRRADRLAAVGQLSASMAHEIRNPLAAIANSVDMLRDELPVQGEQRNLMDLVVKESERLNRILDDFLEYAASRPLESEVAPIFDSLEEVVAIMRRHPDIGSDIDIALDDCTDGIALACIDVELMKQVYVNLALNAFEAMSHRGTLRITVDRCFGGELGLSDAPYVAIHFVDTGPGIEPGAESTIFEPFRTTKPQGTGLGLSIAAKLVESHGGRLEAANTAKGGAEFIIYVPEVTGTSEPFRDENEDGAIHEDEPGATLSEEPSSTAAWGQAMEESRNVR